LSVQLTQSKHLVAANLGAASAKQPHFVFAKDGEVVFQVVGSNGPSCLTRIEPKQP